MDLQELSLGLYLHVPFCSSECAYCSFYKEAPEKAKIKQFLTGIENDLNCHAHALKKRSVKTIFWGGGSPSILKPDELEELGQLFLRHFKKMPYEWTVEVSPLSIKPEKLTVLKSLGVNRISLGVQSFQLPTLQKLGRRQTPAQAYRAYDQIRAAGFSNVNLDLIFAESNQKLQDWEADLNAAISLGPEHLSTYCLTYEQIEGPFKVLEKFDKDLEAKERSFYRFTWNYLTSHGFQQYEISNFSKPGYACLHNLNTWKMQEWIGLGPSAASQFERQRFQNAPSLQAWLKGEKVNVVALNEVMLMVDSLIFGLRMNMGVSLEKLKERFPNLALQKFRPLWHSLRKNGYIHFDGDLLTCTEKGRLVVDSLGLEILAYEEAC